MAHSPETTNHLDWVLSLLHQTANPIAITPKSRGGLVLVNQYYSDFISPGSRLILPQHFRCKAIYVVGTVEFCTLRSWAAQQKSLRNRIVGISLLGRILQEVDNSHRACLLVNLLCNRLSLEVVKQADLSVLGALGRVPLDFMREGIRLYEHNLCLVGQTERLGDRYRLAWQRSLLPPPELLLDAADLSPLNPENQTEYQGSAAQPVFVPLG